MNLDEFRQILDEVAGPEHRPSSAARTRLRRGMRRTRQRRRVGAGVASLGVAALVVAMFTVNSGSAHRVQIGMHSGTDSTTSVPAVRAAVAPLASSTLIVSTGTSLLGNSWSPSTLGVIAANSAGAITIRPIAFPQHPSWTIIDPGLSNDRTRVAFVVVDTSNANGVGAIYSAGVDGSGLTELTTGPNDSMPRFSPDGKSIAFTRNGSLWLMTPTGSDERPLGQTSSVTGLSWSPDGARIAFSSVDIAGGQEISVVNTADGATASFSPKSAWVGSAPSWSPDGTSLVFGDGSTNGLEIRNVDGTESRQITTCAAPCSNDGSPTWSPDGNSIAFVRSAEGKRQIFAVRSDGTSLRQLTNTPDDVCCPA